MERWFLFIIWKLNPSVGLFGNHLNIIYEILKEGSAMPEEREEKAFYIKAYYKNLEQRISFLKELHEDGHVNEALMLCCCYIEALGSQRYQDSDRKAKNYCTILDEHGGDVIFGLVHPKRALQVLSTVNLFQRNIVEIQEAISGIENQLYEKRAFLQLLAPVTTPEQQNWLNENVFKLTIAAISYDHVRCQLVHDISAGPVSFSETTFNGKPLPSIEFRLLYKGLKNVFAKAKCKSIETNKWYWEQ
ncbi:MAG: hypothetical protein WCU00_03045 [Candidatus Latescibacterota bacterium]